MIIKDKVKKTPGQSFIQIDGILQNFMAGELKNIDAHLVYRILSDVFNNKNEYIPLFCDMTESFFSFITKLQVNNQLNDQNVI